MPLITCKECGAQISDKSLSCIKCGAPTAYSLEKNKERIKNITESNDNSIYSEKAQDKDTKYNKKSHSTKMIIFLVSIILLVSLAIFVLWLAGNSDKKPNDINNTNSTITSSGIEIETSQNTSKTDAQETSSGAGIVENTTNEFNNFMEYSGSEKVKIINDFYIPLCKSNDLKTGNFEGNDLGEEGYYAVNSVFDTNIDLGYDSYIY